MRRVLLVTTRSAKDIVLGVAESLRGRYDVDVFVTKAAVAQLASCEDLALELREALPECRYDVVLIPGLVRGSAEVIERALGCRTYKGSKYAGDIPLVLDLLERGLKLSKEVPADELFESFIAMDIGSRFKKLLDSKTPEFSLGGVGVFLDPPPMLLLLEVMASGDRRAVEEKVLRAVSAGFEGVVIGCSNACDKGIVADLASRVRELLGAGVVGVDLPRPADLTKDIADAADLLFNVTAEDVDKVAHLIDGEKGVVTIPSTIDDLDSSLGSLARAVSMLKEVGVSKVVVDPLVKPPGVGFADSLVRFYYSRRRLRQPHLFGTANVYEMVDADSHGIVALLLSVAMELGASLVLATEESGKAFGAIEEHAVARYMAYSAHLRRSPPKDCPHGVNLLVVKGKRFEGVVPGVSAPEIEVGLLEARRDPKYYLRVRVDGARNLLVVDVASAESGEVLSRFAGRDPMSLARAVVRTYDLTVEHAAYLGYELAKAEVALKFRRRYEQDSEVIVTPSDKLKRLDLPTLGTSGSRASQAPRGTR